MFFKRFTGAVLGIATLAALPTVAKAESDFVTGAAVDSGAEVSLDFSIVIPSFIFLRVGTLGTTVDFVEFDVSVDQASGVDVSGSAVARDPVARTNGGAIDVAIISNAGAVQLTATTISQLENPEGDQISWTEIDVSDQTIDHPAFVDNGESNAVVFNDPVNVLTGTWEFFYKNTNVVAAGRYGAPSGGAAGTGRVVYKLAPQP